MNSLYLIAFFSIVAAFIFVLLITVIIKSRKPSFPIYKVNLAKKFLTFCFGFLVKEKINEEDILKEFLNLLQKIFEARFVAYFSLISDNEELVYHSEPFFPYTHGINSLIDLLSKEGLRSVLTKEQIYLIELDQNRHRLSIPISVSSIPNKSSRKIIEGINSDTIVLVPIYKTFEEEGVYFVFTKSKYFSKENEAIVNLLIDYVSLMLVLSSSKDTIEKLFTTIRLGLRSEETHFEIDKNIKSILTNNLLEVAKMVDIPLLIVNKANDDIILANDSFVEWFSDNPTGKNLNEVLSRYKSISDKVIFSGSGMFEMKKVVLPNLDIYGIIFYQFQVVDKKIMSSLYNELLEIRKYFSFINKISLPLGRDDIFVRYQPNDKISETGGDTFVLVEQGKKTFFGVFDVSGHSISSGFIALTIKSHAERLLRDTGDVLVTINALNELLVQLSEEDNDLMYATGIICELDREKGTIKYVCAGHKYGIVLKEDSIVELSEISTINKPLGISLESKFTLNTFEVFPGDKIFLYTDGIVEIEDEKGLIIDNSKIIDLIVFCKDFTIRETVNEIFAYVKSLKSVKIVDDFLILGIKV
jgi:hypothetical protein